MVCVSEWYGVSVSDIVFSEWYGLQLVIWSSVSYMVYVSVSDMVCQWVIWCVSEYYGVSVIVIVCQC